MKQIITIIITLIVSFSFAQENKEALLAQKKANSHVYEGNELVDEDDFVSAEMEYRKAISEQSNNVAGMYNLGNSYYKKGNLEEALYRHQQAAQSATNKEEKAKAYHNIGNVLMQNQKCKEAVDAFKNALRNNPSDDETRYNFALAKECAKQQEDDKQDKDDEQKDEQKNKEDEENKDKEGDKKEDQKDQGEQEKKEGEDEKDEDRKPKDEKEDNGKGDKEKEKEEKKQKPQQGQLSPQQIKSLLEAMNNQEQKVQEKINAEKQKGVPVKTDKDW